jgi:hypothetical protein
MAIILLIGVEWIDQQYFVQRTVSIRNQLRITTYVIRFQVATRNSDLFRARSHVDFAIGVEPARKVAGKGLIWAN